MEIMTLSEQFDTHRRYLTAVAYRMLGSHADAEDAVQEAWFRLDRTDERIDDLRAWLSRVVSRICLDHLRARDRRSELPLERLPDVEAAGADPTVRAENADRLGYALMLILEQLAPDERIAYVLHDVFGLPFDEIAPVVDRSPQAARKLASRARERVRGADRDEPGRHASRDQRRVVVEAFLAAARSGDFAALVGVLHPDVEFRIDQGADGVKIVRGAERVAAQAAQFHRFAVGYDFEIVEVAHGFAVLAVQHGRASSLMFFESEGDRVRTLETRILA